MKADVSSFEFGDPNVQLAGRLCRDARHAIFDVAIEVLDHRGQFRHERDQVLLDPHQTRRDCRRFRGAPRQPNGGIQLVNTTVGLNARVGLRDTPIIHYGRGARVTRLGCYAHELLI